MANTTATLRTNSQSVSVRPSPAVRDLKQRFEDRDGINMTAAKQNSEDALHDIFRSSFRRRKGLSGPGDDCAQLKPWPGKLLYQTVDQVVEGVHVEMGTQPAVMARKLYRFVTPFMLLAIALGLWRLTFQWEYYLSSGWMIAKLLGVVCLVAYHIQTGVYVGRVCRGEDDRTHVFYRVFNEVPVLFLFAIVLLVYLRPALGL